MNLEKRAEAINELSTYFFGDKEDNWEGSLELIGRKVSTGIDFCSL